MGKEQITNIIRQQIRKIITESGWYPAGAGSDSNAPWNDTADIIEIKKYIINYNTQTFDVELSDGTSKEIPFIDFLEKYWRKHPNSFLQHEKLFGDDENTDARIIGDLKKQNYNFAEILEELIY